MGGRTPLSPERRVAGAAIGAAGMSVPERVIENAPIADRLDVDESWIVNRTGVTQRHAMCPDERLSDMAAAAGRAALERARLDAADVDLVLVGTTTKDEVTPDTAPIVAAELGAESAGAVDIGAACTAFVSALALAQGQIESGRAEQVLVIGADALVRYLDPEDRRTAGLFGDGAGAVVMSATDPPGRIGKPVLHADGSQADAIYATQEERKIRMQGQDTFQQAVLRLSEVTNEALEAAGTATRGGRRGPDLGRGGRAPGAGLRRRLARATRGLRPGRTAGPAAYRPPGNTRPWRWQSSGTLWKSISRP